MARLRLAASDAEDLEVLSARLQDAVFKLKDAVWQPRQRRFAAVVNRLQWEEAGKTRVRAGLHFNGVLKAQSSRVKLGLDEAVVSILAMRFQASGAKENEEADPGGVVEIVLAGGGTIRLTVECIDAELLDMTTAWTARGTPDHGAGDGP
jgi:hypothetical protein